MCQNKNRRNMMHIFTHISKDAHQGYHNMKQFCQMTYKIKTDATWYIYLQFWGEQTIYVLQNIYTETMFAQNGWR